MQSQQLDTVIQVEALTVTRGASGGMQKQWAVHAEPYAQRRDLSGNERAASSAGGEVAVARVEFILRERDGITEQMRVRHKGKLFGITHVKPLADYRGWMVLTCDTGRKDG